jgi:hypothetical protein
MRPGPYEPALPSPRTSLTSTNDIFSLNAVDERATPGRRTRPAGNATCSPRS